VTCLLLSYRASLIASGALLLLLLVIVTNTWDGQNFLIPVIGLGILIGMPLSLILIIAGLLSGGMQNPQRARAASAWFGANIAAFVILEALQRWQHSLNFGGP
jgi:hypothetical protein